MTDPLRHESDLLLGAQAMARGMITAEQLASATEAWTQDKSRSLLDILLEQGVVDPPRAEAIRALVSDSDASGPSVAADSLDDPMFQKLRGALDRIDDDDVRSSLNAISERCSQQSDDDAFSQTVTAYGDASGRFAIIRAHAQGGLGEVLLAQDQQLNRQVAIKQIRRQWSDHPAAQERFQQEAEITGRLEHPGVVPVHARGTQPDGRPFYAMRFIRGDSLEDAVAQFHASRPTTDDQSQFTLELRQLLTRFIDVCNTISYAHSRGIIHRDLKPANIMMGKYGETLVVDWGLAKSIGETESRSTKAESLITPGSGSGSAPTQFGSAVGTPQYMSPEQATGRVDRIGPASDVYCLGATLYHLLTGKPPVIEDSLDRTLDRVEHGDIVSAHELSADVPEPLSAICQKAMAVRPADRYKTAKDLATDIECWLADEPVSVFVEPLMARLGRWTRRHRVLATSSVVAVTLLGVATASGSLLWNHFHEQRLLQDFKIKQQIRQRLVELTSSLEASEQLAVNEVRAGRFEAALAILDHAAEELADAPELLKSRRRLQQRADDLRRVVDFYSLAEQAQEANFLSRDIEALILFQSALKTIGAFESGDWWAHLPRGDLSAVQFDELRTMVYRHLITTAGIFVKQVGMKLIGPGGSVERRGFLRSLMSGVGRDEAAATLIVCEMANRFRVAESARWYRGRASRLLRLNYYVSPEDLGPPANTADATTLAYLNLIAAMNPEFLFADYRGEPDPLINAHDTMLLATEMDPDYYWTSLSLGHIHFLMAERAREAGDPEAWRLYDAARQSFGRCIALRPEAAFAYADTSTTCLHQAEALTASVSLTAAAVTHRRDDLIRLALMNAQRARDLAPEVGWIYWHLGQALQSAGQTNEAVDAYLIAVEREYVFTTGSDFVLVDPDDLRGRARAIQLAKQLSEQEPGEPRYHLLLAATLLSNGDVEDARSIIEESLALPNPPTMAWALRGMLRLNDEKLETAESDFQEALQRRPDSPWAAFGLGRCYEQTDRLSEALAEFDHTLDNSVTNNHKAAAELGRCRILLRLGQSEQAIEALRSAKHWQPSSDVTSIGELALHLDHQQVVEVIKQLPGPNADLVINNDRLNQFDRLAVLNGDFELDLSSYWESSEGMTWKNALGCDSAATVTSDERHRGRQSLFIKNSTTSRDPSLIGQTSQTVPSQAGTRYRVTLWAKADQLATRAFRLAINDDKETPLIELPAGTFDWTEITAEFTTPEGDADSTNPFLVPTTLRLISAGPGNVWLDDLSIVALTDE